MRFGIREGLLNKQSLGTGDMVHSNAIKSFAARKDRGGPSGKLQLRNLDSGLRESFAPNWRKLVVGFTVHERWTLKANV